MNDESPQSPKRTRRTPEQIKALLQEQERSDRSAEDFASEHGIAVSTLWRWRRKHRGGAPGAQPRWVEVGNRSGAIGSSAVAEVRLADGLSIELHAGFDVVAMATFVDRLRQR